MVTMATRNILNIGRNWKIKFHTLCYYIIALILPKSKNQFYTIFGRHILCVTPLHYGWNTLISSAAHSVRRRQQSQSPRSVLIEIQRNLVNF